jgi:hypothetical protein
MTFPTSPAAPPPSPPPAAPLLFASVTQDDLATGELVSTTFGVWGRHLLAFGGLSLVSLLPPLCLYVPALLAIVKAAGRDIAGARTSIRLLTIALFTLIPLLQAGGVVHGTLEHLADRPVRFGTMVSAAFRRAPAVVAAGILTYLLVALGTALLVVPGVYAACALTVALPAAAAERLGPVGAIRRSWALTDGSRLTLFFSGLVVSVVVFVANVAAQLAVAWLGPLGALVLVPAQLVLLPLPMILAAVVHHELRVAREGGAAGDLGKVFE